MEFEFELDFVAGEAYFAAKFGTHVNGIGSCMNSARTVLQKNNFTRGTALRKSGFGIKATKSW
jgi:hypothetical protein